MHSVPIETEDGVFTARFSDRGLISLNFPCALVPANNGRQGTFGSAAALWQNSAAAANSETTKWVELTAGALRNLLAGREPAAFPPLDTASGTPFQRRVWQVLQQIPLGRTLAYADVARKAGHGAAVRAAAGACGANRIPVFIPCHRVIARDGRIGGFSAGLHWKRRLLAREGVELALA